MATAFRAGLRRARGSGNAVRGVVALALMLTIPAGCHSAGFVPGGESSRTSPDEVGPRRAPSAIARANSNSGRWTVADDVEPRGAEDVEAANVDLPFIRANRIAAVNVFGEIGGQPAVPFGARGGGALVQHTHLDDGFDADVAVDPGGEWMLFASTRHSLQSDLYLQRTGGLAVTRLTSDPADEAFATFSPDGKRIAFSSNRNGNWDIFVMGADGKNLAAVTSGPAHKLHPSFSPDGRRLVYCSSGRGGQWELWVAELDSGRRTMIGYGLFPAWSPRADKDVIAFQQARQRGGRWFGLWRLDLIDGEPANLTEIAASPTAALVAPAWSPDGTRLAFSAIVEPDGGRMSAQQDVWIVSADGGGRARLTDGRGVHATPFWATDGRIYFISDRGGSETIWSVRADAPNYSTAAVDSAPVGR